MFGYEDKARTRAAVEGVVTRSRQAVVSYIIPV
jgi:hypothetical protein